MNIYCKRLDTYPNDYHTPQLVRMVGEGDADAGKFPLKMRDSAQNACFAYLRTAGLLPADDSDSDGELLCARAAFALIGGYCYVLASRL